MRWHGGSHGVSSAGGWAFESSQRWRLATAAWFLSASPKMGQGWPEPQGHATHEQQMGLELDEQVKEPIAVKIGRAHLAL